MIRNLNIILVFTSVLALIGVYALKYSVEETATQKIRLQQTIERQEADLSMIKADWAYLNQPTHIDPILKRHAEVLGLQVINQKQFSTFDTLPMRPVSVPNVEALDQLFASLDAGIDPMNASGPALKEAATPLPSERGPTPVVPAARSSRPVARASRPAALVVQPDPLAALIENAED